MTSPGDLRSGKGHRDENFPVASRLIPKAYRPPILAFYEFVRTADDIADHASLPAEKKLALLDDLEADLLGARRTERRRPWRSARRSPSAAFPLSTPRTS